MASGPWAPPLRVPEPGEGRAGLLPGTPIPVDDGHGGSRVNPGNRAEGSFWPRELGSLDGISAQSGTTRQDRGTWPKLSQLLPWPAGATQGTDGPWALWGCKVRKAWPGPSRDAEPHSQHPLLFLSRGPQRALPALDGACPLRPAPQSDAKKGFLQM